jgi:hypothetical protein
MPYIPYGEEGEWKKRFEMTIPILLLILVLVIVAAKMNWLVGVPFIGDLFKGPNIDIAVIGNDQNLVKIIDIDVRKDLPVNYMIFKKEQLNHSFLCGVFDKYDMLILTEGQDGDTIELDQFILDECLKNFVASGKPAIVIKRAGTKVTGDNASSGWTMMGFVPAQCKTSRLCPDVDATSLSYTRISMYSKDLNNPITRAYDIEPLNFQGPGQIEFVSVIPEGGKPLLQAEILPGPHIQDALIQSNSGKVIYFAFHPSLYSPLLYNSIKNLG